MASKPRRPGTSTRVPGNVDGYSPGGRSTGTQGSSSSRSPAAKPQEERSDALQALIDAGLIDEDNLGDEDGFGNETFWQDAVLDQIESDIERMAKTFDTDLDYVLGWFEGQKDSLINYLNGWQTSPGIEQFNPSTVEGIQNLIRQARVYVGTKWPPFFQGMNAMREIGSGGSGSGRGRGRSGPTSAQIRAQFDLDQMTQAINNLSRGLILKDLDNARAIAKSYVDAIVANPDQELDFETYVRGRILDTPRAKVIYADKPASLSEEQFLQPYVQMAQQMIGPGIGDQLADLAIGGARLGASPASFQSRLNRTSQVQGSAPFLRRLGDQLTGIKEVLR